MEDYNELKKQFDAIKAKQEKASHAKCGAELAAKDARIAELTVDPQERTMFLAELEAKDARIADLEDALGRWCKQTKIELRIQSELRAKLAQAEAKSREGKP